jgi:GH25 family lysozyme M1 (1,4-beta-N-acetylmuramidase)
MTAGPGPMFLQQNPWHAGTPEHAEWAAINARLLDPARERRMARYHADQDTERRGGLRLTVPVAEHAEQLAALSVTGVLFGPDCSQYQGRPSWATVAAAGCAIGGYKVSEGRTYRDPAHAYNQAAVPGAGLVPLAYHYLYGSAEYANHPELWAAQARWYCSLVDPHAIHALDVEAPMASPGLGVSAWVAEYRRHFPAKPLLIYTNHGQWLYRSHVTDRWPAGAQLWHAGISDGRYTATTGGLTTEWAGINGLSNSMTSLGAPVCELWQFTDHAAVPGVSGTCDGNAFLGSRAELEALATGDDVPLTDAEKKEIIEGAGAEAAQQVWATLVNSPYHGRPLPAAQILGDAYRFAVEASYPVKRPPDNAKAGTPTYALQLLQLLGTIGANVDTLEASEAAEATALAALTPAALADAIAAKLGGSADTATVKAAVLAALAEGMPTFDIVAQPAKPPAT